MRPLKYLQLDQDHNSQLGGILSKKHVVIIRKCIGVFFLNCQVSFINSGESNFYNEYKPLKQSKEALNLAGFIDTDFKISFIDTNFKIICWRFHID